MPKRNRPTPTPEVIEADHCEAKFVEEHRHTFGCECVEEEAAYDCEADEEARMEGRYTSEEDYFPEETAADARAEFNDW